MRINYPEWQLIGVANMCSIPQELVGWVADSGSFMQRVKQKGIEPQIQVLQHMWEHPADDENNILKKEKKVLVREVLISHHQHDLMFARSLFPINSLTEDEERIVFVENNPLGTILFNNPNCLRSAFEITCLSNNNFWVMRLQQIHSIFTLPLWARRSSFALNNTKILLTEVFLPGMEILC